MPKPTPAWEKDLLAEPPGLRVIDLAKKYGVTPGRISQIRKKARDRATVKAAAEVPPPSKNARATKSRAASFSSRLADTADALLDDIERARREIAAVDDLKFRAQHGTVLARSLRDLAEAKETLMRDGLPGMTKDELRAALEARVKDGEK